jgi:23S rRNA pseudouridine1911/1915/1917 synthase
MNDNYFFHPSWPILYQDNHLLALYKPAGLLVQGDQTGEVSLLELAKAWIKERYHKPGQVYLGLVHRLDRPVAGVIVYCRTSKAAGRLSEQFRTGTLKKSYLAIVEGHLKDGSGRFIDQIERREARSSRVVEAPTQQSQEARLSYRLLETSGTRSLVEIELETGRHHQIRVQFAHRGYPLLGDMRYGASAPLRHKQIALLARTITFAHPTLKTSITLGSPLPLGWPWDKEPEKAQRPPWNWVEIKPMICLPESPSNPCSYHESMEE